MSDLPKGWVKSKFVNIIQDARLGLVRSTNDQGVTQDFAYIRMQHYDLNGHWSFENLTKISATPDEVKIYELRKNDILFNTRNSYELVGKIAIWKREESGYLYNNNLLRLRFPRDILSSWIAYQMMSPQFRKSLESCKSATTNICAIYAKDLNNQTILLPPLAEQKRIVTKLDSLFAHTRRARQELDHIPKLIERYKQAILSAAFRGDLTAD